MIYGHTPFEHLKKLQRIQAITDPSLEISFPDVGHPAALDIMKVCAALVLCYIGTLTGCTEH